MREDGGPCNLLYRTGAITHLYELLLNGVLGRSDAGSCIAPLLQRSPDQEPRSATVGAQEGAQRPWWRRVFRM
jgi:hypothetical protein